MRFSTFLSPACSNANRARFFRLKERERPPFFLINPQSSLRKTPCRGILKPFDYSRAVYRKESDHGCRYERYAAFKMKELQSGHLLKTENIAVGHAGKGVSGDEKSGGTRDPG